MGKRRGGRIAMVVSCVLHAGIVLGLWSTVQIAIGRPPVPAELRSEVRATPELDLPVSDQPPELPDQPPELETPKVQDAEPPAEEPFAPLPDARPMVSEIAIPAFRVAAIRRLPSPRREDPRALAPTSPPTAIPVSIPCGPTRRAEELSGNPAPRYPARAVRLSCEGTVLLVAYVTVGGSVSKLEIRKTSGHESLDRAALAAVKNWRFSPALRDGVATASRVEVPVRFALK